MGPLDVSRPWDTRAVVGQFRLLQRLWRNVVDENTGEVTVADVAESDIDADTLRALHKAIDGVRQDLEGMRFNTAIAKVTELNNHLTKVGGVVPRTVAERLVLLVAPLAPHVAEELWRKLGTRLGRPPGLPGGRPGLRRRRGRDLRRADQGQGQGAAGGRPVHLEEESWRRRRWPTRRSWPRWAGPGSAR